MFLWFLIIGLLLLLVTNITLKEEKRNNIGLFFIILIMICIGKYTDIYNFESLHCTCNHDLVRTLCWSFLGDLTCCKDYLPLADYECEKCYCLFHKECLPEGHTVLRDSSEEWWRTHIRNGISQGKVEDSR